MTAAAAPYEADRLGLTLTVAVLMHALVILGVTFTSDQLLPSNALPALDVILVKRSTTDAVEDADYLAQANQAGGGTTDEQRRPQSPVAGEIPLLEQGIAPTEVAAAAPAPQPFEAREVLTTESSMLRVESRPTEDPITEKPLPTARELMEQSLSVASLETELGRKLDAYAKRPRRKFISANTREYEFASYMQAWVAKVERIGNLNYPADARRRNLSGSLVLTVAVRRDGSIETIEVVEPSGHQSLDDAAVRIVQLGEPYADFPPEVMESADVLHITRTWQFLPGNRLTGG